MTREDIYDAVSEVDPDLLTEAESYQRRNGRKWIRRVLAVAAGVIVTAGTVWFGWRLLTPKAEHRNPALTGNDQPSENEAVIAETTEDSGKGAGTAEQLAESSEDSRNGAETAEPVRAVSLSCFRADMKTEVLHILQQEFSSFAVLSQVLNDHFEPGLYTTA